MTGSVPFDRAVEYYDLTRGFSEEGTRRSVELLAGAFESGGPILEVGVGTGQLAIPLRRAGADVFGLDLSRPMLDRLREKAGDVRMPLLEADATLMPFREACFRGAYMRWVLHLIGDWRACLREVVRIVEPGGRLLVLIGTYDGPRAEIQNKFAEITGISTRPFGLGWDGAEELDAELAALGAGQRPFPKFVETERDDLDTFVSGIENNLYSWTWTIEDPELLGRAGVDVRRWAEERFGPLEGAREQNEIAWRAYDLAE